MAEVKFISISSDETQHIADRITALRQWYSSFELSPCNACLFDGDTSDISAMDWIFYELGGNSWYWDDGETHSLAWGNVLVRRFGFHWVKLEGDLSPRHFAVRNDEVPYIVFPWPRLYELVKSAGHQHSAAQDLFLSIISDLDTWSVVPVGWHPALDALADERPDFPKDVIALLQNLSNDDPEWIDHLGMFPYEWNKDAPWDMVRTTIRAWIDK